MTLSLNLDSTSLIPILDLTTNDLCQFVLLYVNFISYFPTDISEICHYVIPQLQTPLHISTS